MYLCYNMYYIIYIYIYIHICTYGASVAMNDSMLTGCIISAVAVMTDACIIIHIIVFNLCDYYYRQSSPPARPQATLPMPPSLSKGLASAVEIWESDVCHVHTCAAQRLQRHAMLRTRVGM